MNDPTGPDAGGEGRSVEGGELRPDLDKAVELLGWIRPGGTVALTAIYPDGGPGGTNTKTETFDSGDEPAIRDWLEARTLERMNL